MAPGFWKAVHSPDSDVVEEGGSAPGSALKAPASLPHRPPHTRPPQGRDMLAPREAHWTCWLRPPIRPSVGQWVRGWVLRWRCLGSGGYWGFPLDRPGPWLAAHRSPLTAAYALPAGAAARGRRCARSSAGASAPSASPSSAGPGSCGTEVKSAACCPLSPPPQALSTHCPTTASTFPGRPHLHSLLRGQQLLLFFGDLEDEAWVALHCLAISWRPRPWQPALPGVGSCLAEAWTLGPTLTLPKSLGQALPPHSPESSPSWFLPSREQPAPPLPASVGGSPGLVR